MSDKKWTTQKKKKIKQKPCYEVISNLALWFDVFVKTFLNASVVYIKQTNKINAKNMNNIQRSCRL